MLAGSICPNATTTITSALYVLNSSTNASSLALSGCKTVIPCATASSLTGEKTSD